MEFTSLYMKTKQLKKTCIIVLTMLQFNLLKYL